MCQFFESSSNFTSTIKYPMVWARFCLSSVSGLNHLARCNTVSADRQTAFVSTLTRFLQVFGEQRYTLSPTALQVGIKGSVRSSCCSQIPDTASRTAQVYGFLYFFQRHSLGPEKIFFSFGEYHYSIRLLARRGSGGVVLLVCYPSSLIRWFWQ